MTAAPTAEQIEQPDGRVDLSPDVRLGDDRLFNDDLAPTKVAARTWSTYAFAALWISMAHCIPTYILASGLIKMGMSWEQALLTILVGNTIVLAPILLNSHPGTKYGIPFPVFARAAYGVFGANLPAVMRALVACGWFGIQCWIGGHALQRFFESLSPAWPTALGDAKIAGYLPTEWFCFAIFWGINILIVYRGMDLLRRVENWAAPYVLVMTALLLVWILRRASAGGHDIGALVSQPSKFPTVGAFLPVFVPSVTAMVGFWATLSLNMPDFTRYGRSQKEQVVGQVVALPTTMTLFAAMGVIITSASAQIFGEAIWNPVDLGAKFESRWVVALAELTAVIATLAMNIAANVVSPANDIANLAPKRISFRTGVPHHGAPRDLHDAVEAPREQRPLHRRLAPRLLGRPRLDRRCAHLRLLDPPLRDAGSWLADLYRRDGVYAYGSPLGVHWAAVGATAAGCFVAWIGIFVPACSTCLYDAAAWFSGDAERRGGCTGWWGDPASRGPRPGRLSPGPIFPTRRPSSRRPHPALAKTPPPAPPHEWGGGRGASALAAPPKEKRRSRAPTPLAPRPRDGGGGNVRGSPVRLLCPRALEPRDLCAHETRWFGRPTGGHGCERAATLRDGRTREEVDFGEHSRQRGRASPAPQVSPHVPPAPISGAGGQGGGGSRAPFSP